MSDEALERLAAKFGVEPRYLALTGDLVEVSDDTRRALLEAMGIAAGDADAIAESLSEAAPPELASIEAPPDVRCFVPDWLREDRVWGIGCQLYALRSERNWGIGDFEDLARLAEIAANAGADFLGVNPLHEIGRASCRERV